MPQWRWVCNWWMGFTLTSQWVCHWGTLGDLMAACTTLIWPQGRPCGAPTPDGTRRCQPCRTRIENEIRQSAAEAAFNTPSKMGGTDT